MNNILCLDVNLHPKNPLPVLQPAGPASPDTGTVLFHPLCCSPQGWETGYSFLPIYLLPKSIFL